MKQENRVAVLEDSPKNISTRDNYVNLSKKLLRLTLGLNQRFNAQISECEANREAECEYLTQDGQKSEMIKFGPDLDLECALRGEIQGLEEAVDQAVLDLPLIKEKLKEFEVKFDAKLNEKRRLLNKLNPLNIYKLRKFEASKKHSIALVNKMIDKLIQDPTCLREYARVYNEHFALGNYKELETNCDKLISGNNPQLKNNSNGERLNIPYSGLAEEKNRAMFTAVKAHNPLSYNVPRDSKLLFNHHFYHTALGKDIEEYLLEMKGWKEEDLTEDQRNELEKEIEVFSRCNNYLTVFDGIPSFNKMVEDLESTAKQIEKLLLSGRDVLVVTNHISLSGIPAIITGLFKNMKHGHAFLDRCYTILGPALMTRCYEDFIASISNCLVTQPSTPSARFIITENDLKNELYKHIKKTGFSLFHKNPLNGNEEIDKIINKRELSSGSRQKLTSGSIDARLKKKLFSTLDLTVEEIKKIKKGQIFSEDELNIIEIRNKFTSEDMALLEKEFGNKDPQMFEVFHKSLALKEKYNLELGEGEGEKMLEAFKEIRKLQTTLFSLDLLTQDRGKIVFLAPGGTRDKVSFDENHTMQEVKMRPPASGAVSLVNQVLSFLDQPVVYPIGISDYDVYSTRFPLPGDINCHIGRKVDSRRENPNLRKIYSQLAKGIQKIMSKQYDNQDLKVKVAI